MSGAVFYASKYGSTAEYARLIGAAAKLPVFDVSTTDEDPSRYDFLVLGSPIIYYKLILGRWARRHQASILGRPGILFSVSGAGPGEKLDRWIARSLPAGMIAHLDHVALRGRQDPGELTLYDRTMLKIAGLANRDRRAGREEMQGFDYTDPDSIAPIVRKIRALQGQPIIEAVSGDGSGQSGDWRSRDASG